MIRVVSLFSGVGCFDLGFEQAGMTTVAQCEIDKHATGVLQRHWPNVPRFGDVSQLNGADLPEHEVLCFGSPCQDLSIAGAGAGLDGERSGLFFEAVRVIREARNAGRGPIVAVWENVKHACRSNDGRDFGTVVNTLADAGALDIEWKCLDAQFFDVPQRRQRVFLCAWFDSGNGRGTQIFPVTSSVRRDSDAGNQAWPTVAGGVDGGVDHGGLLAETGVTGALTQGLGSGGPDAAHARNGWLIPTRVGPVDDSMVSFVKAKRASSDTDDETWTGDGPAPTLNAFDNNSETRATVVTVQRAPIGTNMTSPVAPSLFEDEDESVNSHGLLVRRLTPRECERLMGLPDDWTRWYYTGRQQADSHRYRQCGNGIVVNVAKYVGERIVLAGTERDLWSV